MNINDIKKLREKTGAGVMEVKEALEKAKGDFEKAREELMSKVSAKAAKKSDRTAADGLVYSYIHNGGKVGAMVLVACETDFVAKTDDFQKLCHELALQICTGDYKNVKDLVEDEYIKDSSKRITDLINEVIAKVGEKIEVKDFVKLEVGA